MNHANEMTGLIFISVFLTDGGEMQKKKPKNDVQKCTSQPIPVGSAPGNG